MTARSPRNVASRAFAVCLLTGGAYAAESPCSALEVHADAGVRDRFPAAAENVHAAFDARPNVDRCARVALTLEHAALTVAVALPDGRVASRRVAHDGDVVSTLEALLLVPPDRARPAADAPSPPVPPVPAQPVPANAGRPGRDAAPRAADEGEAEDGGRLRIELSALTGARIGDGQAGVGIGILSLLDVSAWLAGFEVRADRYEPLGGGGTPGGALELAVVGGRRFPYRAVAFGLTAGVAAEYQGTSTVETQAAPAGPVGSSRVDLQACKLEYSIVSPK